MNQKHAPRVGSGMEELRLVGIGLHRFMIFANFQIEIVKELQHRNKRFIVCSPHL
jgi:hypothetical protein